MPHVLKIGKGKYKLIIGGMPSPRSYSYKRANELLQEERRRIDKEIRKGKTKFRKKSHHSLAPRYPGVNLRLSI